MMSLGPVLRAIAAPALVAITVLTPSKADETHRLSGDLQGMFSALQQLDRAVGDPQVALPHFGNLAALRRLVISRLLTVALSEAPQRRGWKCEAIQTLGHWRAVEAADRLIEQIEFTEPLLDSRRRPLSSYPAAEALVNIGAPSCEKIIDRLVRPTNDQQIWIFACVIQSIDGQELGLARLHIALAKESSPARQKNVKRLIQVYEATNFANPADWPHPSNNKKEKKGGAARG